MTMSVNLIMAIIMVTPVTIHQDSHHNPRSPGDGTVSSLARPQQRLWAGKQIKTYFEICFTFLNDQAFPFLNDQA